MRMTPREPSERAAAIVSAVAVHVDVDLAPIRAAVAERLAEPSAAFVCERAGTIADAAIAERCAEELVVECRRGLAEAHESFLLTASRCLEAADDLERGAGDSWTVLAARHRLAGDAAWDAMATSEHVESIEWCAAETNDRHGEEAPIERSER